MNTDQSLKTTAERIVKREGVCGGDACVHGTRIPVWSIIESWRFGVTEAELPMHFTTSITPEDVQAAFGYFRAHPEEIEEAIQKNQEA
jgi:uncharacterized protein (DUF433 family)